MNRTTSFILSCVIAFALMISSTITTHAFTIPVHTPEQGFVCDYADLISEECEVRLETELAAYENKTEIEVVVVIINTLGEEIIEEVVNKWFNEWGIGKKTDNGVLFFIAFQDHKMRIEVGYGLEPFLTDAQSGRIVSINGPVANQFRKNQIDEGVTTGAQLIVDALGNYAKEERATILAQRVALQAKQKEKKEEDLYRVLAVLSAWFTFTVFYYVIKDILNKAKKRKLEKKRKELLIRSLNAWLLNERPFLDHETQQFRLTEFPLSFWPQWLKEKASKLIDEWKVSIESAQRHYDIAVLKSRIDPDAAKQEYTLLTVCLTRITTVKKELLTFKHPDKQVRKLIALLQLELVRIIRLCESGDVPEVARAMIHESNKKHVEVVSLLREVYVRSDDQWFALWARLIEIQISINRAENLASDALKKAATARRIKKEQKEERKKSSHTTDSTSGNRPSSPSKKKDEGISFGGGKSGGAGASGGW